MATAALTQKDSFKNTAHPSTLSSTTRFFFFVFLIPRYQLIWEKFSTIFQYQLLQGTVVAQSGTVGQDAEFIPFAGFVTLGRFFKFAKPLPWEITFHINHIWGLLFFENTWILIGKFENKIQVWRKWKFSLGRIFGWISSWWVDFFPQG